MTVNKNNQSSLPSQIKIKHQLTTKQFTAACRPKIRAFNFITTGATNINQLQLYLRTYHTSLNLLTTTLPNKLNTTTNACRIKKKRPKYNYLSIK